MKKKRVIIILLIVLLLAVGEISAYFIIHAGKKDDSTNNTSNKEKEPQELATPILYEVTKEGSKATVYLFGSIHVADDRAYPMQGSIMEAYENSEAVAVEFDMIEYMEDLDAQMEAVTDMLLPEGSTIGDVLLPETYDILIPYVENTPGYMEIFEVYSPMFYYSLVSSEISEKSDLSSDEGIDYYFLEMAKDDGKKILEVETASYQNELLASFPHELYDLLIRYTIENEEEMIEETIVLYELWLEGDEEDFSAYIDAESTNDEVALDYPEYPNAEALLKDYDQKLIYDRNAKMTSTVMEYFNGNEDVFVVVGAAHIIGSTGIAESLRNLGYNVEIVEY